MNVLVYGICYCYDTALIKNGKPMQQALAENSSRDNNIKQKPPPSLFKTYIFIFVPLSDCNNPTSTTLSNTKKIYNFFLAFPFFLFS